MNDVICVVMTTEQYNDRIERIENTWAKDIPTVFYSDHQDTDRKIVKVSDLKEYCDTEEKNINIINMIRDGYENILNDYEWICFCDDDTFINSRVVYEEINYLNKLCLHGNLTDRLSNPSNPIYIKPGIPLDLKYLCGGAGFFISTNLLKLSGNFKNYNTGFGDVGVGMNCYYKKIPVINNELFCSNTPAIHKHSDNIIKTKLSYHYIKTDDEMKYLYSLTK